MPCSNDPSEEVDIDMEEENDLNTDDEDVDKIDEAVKPVTDDSIAKLVGHTKDVFCLALSLSKRWLASGSEDDTAIIWDLESNETQPFLRILDHIDSVNCLSFNNTSTLLASGDMKGRICITEIQSKSQTCKVDDSSDLEWLLWHLTADILFGGCSDGLVWMWLITADGVSQSKVFTGGSISSCVVGKLMPDGKRLLVGHDDGQVRIWDLKEATATTVNVSSPCCSLDIHHLGNLAAIGCEDGKTALLNTLTCKVVSTFGTKIQKTQEETNEYDENSLPAKNSVEVVRFSPLFPWLAIGTLEGNLTIYDYETVTARHTCEHDGMAVVSCLWKSGAHDSSLCIVSACIDGAIRMWDAKTGDPKVMVSGAGEEVYDFCMLDSSKIFTACSDGVIRVFSC